MSSNIKYNELYVGQKLTRACIVFVAFDMLT